jgi:hypothetical protein
MLTTRPRELPRSKRELKRPTVDLLLKEEYTERELSTEATHHARLMKMAKKLVRKRASITSKTMSLKLRSITQLLRRQLNSSLPRSLMTS